MYMQWEPSQCSSEKVFSYMIAVLEKLLGMAGIVKKNLVQLQ